ncbi:MAG: PAS domain S-box protein [Gemmatimonadetes bacterium]|nr:PAS domain S-box protein [Gemmatimonadota bacterium]
MTRSSSAAGAAPGPARVAGATVTPELAGTEPRVAVARHPATDRWKRPVGPSVFITPWRLSARVLLMIVFAETLVITLLELAIPPSRNLAGIFQAGLAGVVLSAPFVWWGIARPLRGAASVAHDRATAVIAHAIDGIITINDHGFIESLNPAAERIFGHNARAVVGQPVTCLMPLRYRDAHRMALLRARATGEVRLTGRRHELFGLRHDGSEFPLELSLACWKIAEGTFFTGIVRDLTGRNGMPEEPRETGGR